MKIVAERHPRPGLYLHSGKEAGWTEGTVPEYTPLAIGYWQSLLLPADANCPSRTGMYYVRLLGRDIQGKIIAERSIGWPSGAYQDWEVLQMEVKEYLELCEMSRQFQYWMGIDSADTGQWWPAKREQIRREAERKREIPLPSI